MSGELVSAFVAINTVLTERLLLVQKRPESITDLVRGLVILFLQLLKNIADGSLAVLQFSEEAS